MSHFRWPINRALFFFGLAFILITPFVCANTLAEDSLPALSGRVVDNANLLSPTSLLHYLPYWDTILRPLQIPYSDAGH